MRVITLGLLGIFAIVLVFATFSQKARANLITFTSFNLLLLAGPNWTQPKPYSRTIPHSCPEPLPEIFEKGVDRASAGGSLVMWLLRYHDAVFVFKTIQQIL
jgi:hypothetical protein